MGLLIYLNTTQNPFIDGGTLSTSEHFGLALQSKWLISLMLIARV